MFTGKRGCYAPSGGAVQETILQKIRFVNVLQSTGIFPDSSGQSFQTYRSSLEVLDQSQKNPPVNLVQTVLIDFQKIQGKRSYIVSNSAVVFYLSKIPDSFEETIGKTGGVPRDRLAPAAAPSGSISTSRTCAERRMTRLKFLPDYKIPDGA